MIVRLLPVLFLLAVTLTGAASAQDSSSSSVTTQASSLLVTDPRIRAMPPGSKTTAAYLNIKNTGK
ncbi:MAG: copper chaperone PCu(A)C, partial [Desulfovibrionales bacterium]|nr:copper chaperone PCu(A)C [Desulfovibrionales bacterium]